LKVLDSAQTDIVSAGRHVRFVPNPDVAGSCYSRLAISRRKTEEASRHHQNTLNEPAGTLVGHGKRRKGTHGSGPGDLQRAAMNLSRRVARLVRQVYDEHGPDDDMKSQWAMW
jgi:hypothetical protein